MTKEQTKVCNHFKKYSKLSSKAFKEAVEEKYSEGDAFITIPINAQSTMCVGTICESVPEFSCCVRYDSLIKTSFYASFIELTDSNANVDIVCAPSRGDLVAVYKAGFYDGYGGIFVKGKGAKEGIVIELLPYYLLHRFPPIASEVDV